MVKMEILVTCLEVRCWRVCEAVASLNRKWCHTRALWPTRVCCGIPQGINGTCCRLRDRVHGLRPNCSGSDAWPILSSLSFLSLHFLQLFLLFHQLPYYFILTSFFHSLSQVSYSLHLSLFSYSYASTSPSSFSFTSSFLSSILAISFSPLLSDIIDCYLWIHPPLHSVPILHSKLPPPSPTFKFVDHTDVTFST